MILYFDTQNEFDLFLRDMREDLGDMPEGFVEFHADGRVSFIIADTTTPYGA